LGFGWGPVGSASNEIPAIPALLGVLKLGGTVVTTDTMGCRTAHPQPDGCNVVSPKDTHPTLHE
jgi:predicted transposase YbfD/YdcC